MPKQNGEKVPTTATAADAVHDHMTEFPIATVVMAINKIVVAVRDNLGISIRCFDQLDWNRGSRVNMRDPPSQRRSPTAYHPHTVCTSGREELQTNCDQGGTRDTALRPAPGLVGLWCTKGR